MSQQNDVRIVTGVEVDKKSIRDGERAYDRIGKAAQDSARQIRDIGREQERIVREFREGVRTYEEAARELRDLGDSAENTERALRSLRSEQERLNKTEQSTRRFDATKKDVALAGDVQSNLGAVSGLAGAAGAGGVSQGIGVAGEVAALVEELPSLKSALQGMPSVLLSAAQAIGPFGIAVAGLVAGFVAGIQIVKAQQRELRDTFNARIDSEQELNNRIGELTTERINEEIAANELVLERQRDLLNRLDAAYTQGAEEAGGFINFLLAGDLRKQLNEQRDIVEDLEQTNVGLNSKRNDEIVLMNDAAAAAEEAAAAEQALADARLSASEAELNAQRSLNSQLATLTTEQIETRLRAAQIELKAQQQLLSSLEGLQRVQQGNVITSLEAEINALNGALGSETVAANDAAKAAEEAAKELEKMKKATDGVAESTRRAGLSMGAWSEATLKAFEERQAAAEKATDEIRDIHERRLELVRDFNQREAEIIKQSLFDRNQAHERFLFDEQRLLERGMFSSAFDARREQSFSNRQTGERLRFEQTQRSDSLTNQIRELAAEFRQLQLTINVNSSPMFETQVSTTSRTIAARTVNRTFSRGAFRR